MGRKRETGLESVNGPTSRPELPGAGTLGQGCKGPVGFEPHLSASYDAVEEQPITATVEDSITRPVGVPAVAVHRERPTVHPAVSNASTRHQLRGPCSVRGRNPVTGNRRKALEGKRDAPGVPGSAVGEPRRRRDPAAVGPVR